MEKIKKNDLVLEKEWEQLMMEAKNIGLAPKEVRDFFLKKKIKRKAII